jgi:hypothetical protein
VENVLKSSGIRQIIPTFSDLDEARDAVQGFAS